MRQIAGAGVILAVAVAAMRFVGGSQSSSPAAAARPRVHVQRGSSVQNVPAQDDAYQGGCTVFDPEDDGSPYPKDADRGAAKSVIDQFFALKDSENSPGRHVGRKAEPQTPPVGPSPSSADAGAPQTTLKQKTGVRFVVALAPDPRHTNLSLLFDREMVAIQQAAQDEGYNFNSSWLPWKTESVTYGSVADEQRSDDFTAQRESCPGVLLFRRSVTEFPPASSKSGDSFDDALVVLVVGEQPTGGVNESQWNNAIAFLHHNASALEVPPPSLDATAKPAVLVPRKLNVLGPTFSGSLASLERALFRIKSSTSARPAFPAQDTSIEILGGSVRGCTAIRWFQNRLQQEFNGRAAFASFEENDSVQVYNFLNYLNRQGTDISDVAILSEDETAYAYTYVPPGTQPVKKEAATGDAPGSCDFSYDLSSRPVRFSYPRDISALRSAYEKQSVFSGSAARATHPVLDDGAELAAETADVSDTIPSFGGSVTPVNQEAILYGIVSNLRSHHSRFILLRCTNPLDFLFLTRFFHRAYPEGRIVTVGSDLLFRREIDTTEFRGVLALSSYSLLPRNQHWSHLSQDASPANTLSHTHRIPESDQESEYLAARYLFDRRATQDLPQPLPDAPPNSKQPPLLLSFKENLPDFADPFWLHKPGDGLARVQAPTWLSVVGRDGYWPLAVLNDDTTPNQCLDRGRDSESSGPCPAHPLQSSIPPSTMARLDGTQASRSGAVGAHYDLNRSNPQRFNSSILFGMPRPWDLCAICVCVLLCYQLFGITHGRELTSFGLFALFRRIATPSQAILLGVNCALALAAFTTLITVELAVPSFNGALGSWLQLIVFGILWPVWHVVFFFFLFRSEPGRHWLAPVTFAVAVLGSDIALIASFATGLDAANTLPLFYRMGHLTGGVSPLVPPLFLVLGAYLWTWQALAGNSMLCCGRPLLPEIEHPVLPGTTRTLREYWKSRAYYRFLGLPAVPAGPPTHFLPGACLRISNEMGKRIVKIASPLCVDPKVILLPVGLFIAAVSYFVVYGMPLLGFENHAYTGCINFALLIAFLVTIAEAARFFMTWKELQRLLTALSRLRLRRTFAKLHAIPGSSLWSVSGSVQRIQYQFFALQLDAAKRLCTLPGGDLPSVVAAVSYGKLFSEECAARIGTGAVWENSLRPEGTPPVYIRQVLNDAVADVLNKLFKHWETETTSLSLEPDSSKPDPKSDDKHSEGDSANTPADMELAEELLVRTQEEFVCFHYIAFIQNILGRMRTMVLSMTFLFVSVCFAISFYPFVPRTGISMWMLVNLVLIAASVVYVYAGMERDATLSYITNTRPGNLGTEFYVKTATFLAGPLIGLLTTQFPAISESFLSFLQPGLDALK